MGLLSRRKREADAAAELERAKAEASAAYDAAVVEAKRSGGMVCGTYRPDGRPVYWVQDREAPDAAIEAKAFKHREGRDITPGEVILRQAADALKARA